MGTALTGLEIKDTYDSLIKVTDNGPISGTAKYLSDGLGNDSVLALSNARVGVGTASPAVSLNVEYTDITSYLEGIRVKNLGNSLQSQSKISCYNSSNNYVELIQNSATLNGDALIYTNAAPLAFNVAGTERIRITTTGNVGIGSLATSGARLESFVSSAGATPTPTLRLQNTGNGYQAKIILTDGTTNDGNIVYQGAGTGDGQYIGFGIGAAVNDVQVTGSRYLRMAASTGGIQFNGDTAAANALDDYEEGTWTPSISFGGASVGVTYSAGTSARYTKIGRQVSVTCYILLTSKGSSTGAARIGGLPFTIANAGGFYSAGSLAAVDNTTYGGQIQTYGDINTTNFVLNDISEAGVQGNITDADFTNGSQLIFSATYFV